MLPGEGCAPCASIIASPGLPAAPTWLIEGEALAAAIRAATPAGGAVGSPEAEARLATLEGLVGTDLRRTAFVPDECGG